MSGQLLVEKPSAPDETHLRARFTFTDGGRELRFVDQRTFGGLVVEEVDRARRSPTGSRTSRSIRSTRASTTPASPPRCAAGAPRSSAPSSTRR